MPSPTLLLLSLTLLALQPQLTQCPAREHGLGTPIPSPAAPCPGFSQVPKVRTPAWGLHTIHNAHLCVGVQNLDPLGGDEQVDFRQRLRVTLGILTKDGEHGDKSKLSRGRAHTELPKSSPHPTLGILNPRDSARSSFQKTEKAGDGMLPGCWAVAGCPVSWGPTGCPPPEARLAVANSEKAISHPAG